MASFRFTIDTPEGEQSFESENVYETRKMLMEQGVPVLSIEALPEPISQADAAGYGLGQGLLMGGADELVGLVDEDAQRYFREREAQALRERPATYIASNVAGSLPSALAGVGLASKLPMAGKIAAPAVAGALGALSGGLSANDNRAAGAALGGVLGSGTTAASQAIGKLLTKPVAQPLNLDSKAAYDAFMAQKKAEALKAIELNAKKMASVRPEQAKALLPMEQAALDKKVAQLGQMKKSAADVKDEWGAYGAMLEEAQKQKALQSTLAQDQKVAALQAKAAAGSYKPAFGMESEVGGDVGLSALLAQPSARLEQLALEELLKEME